MGRKKRGPQVAKPASVASPAAPGDHEPPLPFLLDSVETEEPKTQLQDLETRLALPLAEINLDVRTINMLEEFGVLTVNDLLHRTRDELLAIPNFGHRVLQSVYDALEGIGFRRSPQ